MAESWQEYVDLDRLAAWMDAQGLDRGPITDVATLSGGTQNIILRLNKGGRSFVLRRPTRPAGSKVMIREARVLKALAGSDVPAPSLIAACADDDVLGAAFYLMEPIDGFNAPQGLPEQQAASAALRHGMGLAMADGAAALGRVDYLAAGLADFGKTDNYLERQVARWRSQLDGYAEFEGWPGPETIPGVRAVGEWLEENRPSDFTPGIIHGDYHFGNVMFRHDGAGLAAIIDWELATIGDPRQDLGLLLATWPNPDGDEGTFEVRPWDGFPTGEQLVARYAAGSNRDVGQIGWFAVLACYKTCIILEGTHARACAGKASRRTGDHLHKLTLELFARTRRWMT